MTPRATPTATAAVPTSTPTPTPTTPIPTDGGEPTGFEHFHTYAEIDALLDDIAQRHSGIARRISLGTSHEGRRIFAVKISDNAGADEHEPEVFINGGMHARERSSMEMSIYIIEMLTSGYGRDPEITAIVDSTEIFVAPLMNPDGAEFDISGGRFHRWRKNRQPIPGSAEIGVDLNRQFDFMWGCCGGSSDNPRKEHYRGPDPWFAPEVRAYRDFVNSRVVNGQQQITTIISWHSAGRLVLWPYYFTKTDIPPQMRVDDHATFVALGQRAARLNGYRAQQGSDLYIADGDQDDWAYHEHRIFAFTIEMAKGNGRYYPTAAELNADMAANRAAALLLLDFADCPYRAANLEATYCA